MHELLANVIFLHEPDLPLVQDCLATSERRTHPTSSHAVLRSLGLSRPRRAVSAHGISPRREALISLAKLAARLRLHVGPCSFLGCIASRFGEDAQVAMVHAALTFDQMSHTWKKMKRLTKRRLALSERVNHVGSLFECGYGVINRVRNVHFLLSALARPATCLQGYSAFKLQPNSMSDDSSSASDDTDDELVVGIAGRDSDKENIPIQPGSSVTIRTPPVNACACSADLLLRKAPPNRDELQMLLSEWEM